MKKEGYNLSDKSGDKDNFTIIPNIVADFSSAHEQSLYLIMKKHAGEVGSCYASLNSLVKKMKVDRKTVTKNIKKLLNRGWIEEIEPFIVSGGKVRQFIITDIWLLNAQQYKGAGKRDGVDKVRVLSPKVRVKGTQGAGKRDINNNQEQYKKKSDFLKKTTLKGMSDAEVRGLCQQ